MIKLLAGPTIRHLVSLAIGALVAKGIIDTNTAGSVNTDAVVNFVIAILAGLWNYWQMYRARTNTPAQSPKGAEQSGRLSCWWIIPTLAVIAISGPGCVKMLNATKDRVVAIESRGWGLHLAMNEADQVPSMRVGYFSQKVTMLPTKTNQLYAAPYTSSFGNNYNTFKGHMEEQVSTLQDFKPQPVAVDAGSSWEGLPTNFKIWQTPTNVSEIIYTTNATGEPTICTNCRIGPLPR